MNGIPAPEDLSWRSLPDTEAGVEPLAVFAAAGEEQHRFYWMQPRRDLTLVGVGAALVWRPVEGARRFDEASRFAAALAQRMRPAPDTGDGSQAATAPAGPLLCGGFAFDPPASGTPAHWEDFGAGRLVVPELLGIIYGGAARWVLTAPDGGMEAATDRAGELMRIAAANPLPSLPLPAAVERSPGDDDAYRRTITAALECIEAGTFHKVVPARQVTAHLAGPPDLCALGALLARLAAHYPAATTFAVGRGPMTLLGASPELLVRTGDGVAETDALAGSCSRHELPERDEALAREMLASPKERYEHDAVVEHLRSRMAAAGVALHPVPIEPQVRALPGIQHLWTPLRGSVATPPGAVFRLADALHPTPAVGGLPAGAALAFLRRHEPAGRGWFAGPVGWTDLAGSGELCLVLRSGLVNSPTGEMSLFAGSGVVAGSHPDAELAETDAKLNAVPAVLDSQPLLTGQ